MSKTDFEYECSRAELLGIEPPTWEEFSQRVVNEAENDVEDEATESAQNLEQQGEGIKKAIGGLDELNAILASTQLKINKFKSVCGSFTNLMKVSNWKTEMGSKATEGTPSLPTTPNKQEALNTKTDVESEVADQVDRLDSLIGKAERAEISMSVQNKQMKSYLKK